MFIFVRTKFNIGDIVYDAFIDADTNKWVCHKWKIGTINIEQNKTDIICRYNPEGYPNEIGDTGERLFKSEKEAQLFIEKQNLAITKNNSQSSNRK